MNAWDLKLVAGGLIDIHYYAQYLQLANAAAAPDILDTSTARVFDKAWRLGLISTEYHASSHCWRRLYQGPHHQIGGCTCRDRSPRRR